MARIIGFRAARAHYDAPELDESDTSIGPPWIARRRLIGESGQAQMNI
jgi:hypothetical protein